MATKIYRLPATSKVTGRSRSSIYADIKEGTFPPPVKLGPRSIGWPDDELDAYQRALRAGLSPQEAVKAAMKIRQDAIAEFETVRGTPR